MKAIKTITIAIALAGIIPGMISCSKEKPSATETTRNKIMGKWKMQSVVVNRFSGGVSHITSSPDTSNQVMEFRNDGQVVFTDDHGLYESDPYGVNSASGIWITGILNSWEIRVLTGSDLQLYQKIPGPYSSYDETTWSYRR